MSVGGGTLAPTTSLSQLASEQNVGEATRADVPQEGGLDNTGNPGVFAVATVYEWVLDGVVQHGLHRGHGSHRGRLHHHCHRHFPRLGFGLRRVPRRRSQLWRRNRTFAPLLRLVINLWVKNSESKAPVKAGAFRFSCECGWNRS